MDASTYRRWVVREELTWPEREQVWTVRDNMAEGGFWDPQATRFPTKAEADQAVADLEAASGNMDGETSLAWHVVVTFGATRGRFRACNSAVRYGVDLAALDAAIWAQQDGYGVKGFTPAQGWDWSGIRDSSHLAVRDMAQAIRENLKAQGLVVRVEARGKSGQVEVTWARAPRPKGSSGVVKHQVVVDGQVLAIRRSPRTYTHAVVARYTDGSLHVERWSQTRKAADAFARTFTRPPLVVEVTRG